MLPLDQFNTERRCNGTGEEHIADTTRMLQRFFQAGGIKAPRDLSTEAIASYLAGLLQAGKSLQTRNNVYSAIRCFSNWCVDTDRIDKDPCRRIKMLNAKRDQRHPRRMFSDAEIKGLANAAFHGPVLAGLPGQRRVLL